MAVGENWVLKRNTSGPEEWGARIFGSIGAMPQITSKLHWSVTTDKNSTTVPFRLVVVTGGVVNWGLDVGQWAVLPTAEANRVCMASNDNFSGL